METFRERDRQLEEAEPIELVEEEEIQDQPMNDEQYAAARRAMNLGSKLLKESQAYVALSRVKSMDGLRIEDLDLEFCKKPCNITALAEMDRMRKM
ncbi:hypothetical protein AVEN_59458-1 [Araneus ventricosus]|uniref:Uncharacterized protein n=1 Tax=Araneus ventricosus TaxID=182803 RepID=A0A4Y2N2P4_ARAVE|nr:hypothetical protein AVEN_59458-1 [Araneus ventricosus]